LPSKRSKKNSIREQKSQQIQNELTDQKKEQCKICSKQFFIKDLASHSAFCQDQRGVEEGLSNLKAELFKELPAIREVKNKIKFEVMIYTKDRKKEEGRSQMAERASVGGRQPVSFRHMEIEKPKSKTIRKMGTLNLSEQDTIVGELSARRIHESPVRTIYGQNVEAIQEYSDEEQTPLRKVHKKKSKTDLEQEFKEAFEQPKGSPDTMVFRGFLGDRYSPRGDVHSTISKDEFFNGAEVNSIIPKTKFDPNDSIFEEFSKIGIKNRKLVKKGTFHESTAPLDGNNKLGKQFTNHNSQSSTIQIQNGKDDVEELEGQRRINNSKQGEEGAILNNVLVDEFNGLLSDIDSNSNSSKKGPTKGGNKEKSNKIHSIPQQRPTTRLELQAIDNSEEQKTIKAINSAGLRTSSDPKLQDISLQHVKQNNQNEAINGKKGIFFNGEQMNGFETRTGDDQLHFGNKMPSNQRPEAHGEDPDFEMTDRKYRDENENVERRYDDRDSNMSFYLNKIMDFLNCFESYCRDLSKDQLNLQFDLNMESKALMFKNVFFKEEARADTSLAFNTNNSILEKYELTENKCEFMSFKMLEEQRELDHIVMKYMKDAIRIHSIVLEAILKRKQFLGKLRSIEKSLAQTQGANDSSSSQSKNSKPGILPGGRRTTVMYASFKVKRGEDKALLPLSVGMAQAIEEDENEYRASYRSQAPEIESNAKLSGERGSVNSGFLLGSEYFQEKKSYNMDSPERLSFDPQKDTEHTYRSERNIPTGIDSKFKKEQTTSTFSALQKNLNNSSTLNEGDGKLLEEISMSLSPEGQEDSKKCSIVELAPDMEKSKIASVSSIQENSTPPKLTFSILSQTKLAPPEKEQPLKEAPEPQQNSILSLVQLKKPVGQNSTNLGMGLMKLINKIPDTKLDEMIYPKVWKPAKFIPGTKIESHVAPGPSKWGKYIPAADSAVDNSAEEEDDEPEEEEHYEGEGEEELLSDEGNQEEQFQGEEEQEEEYMEGEEEQGELENAEEEELLDDDQLEREEEELREDNDQSIEGEGIKPDLKVNEAAETIEDYSFGEVKKKSHPNNLLGMALARTSTLKKKLSPIPELSSEKQSPLAGVIARHKPEQTIGQNIGHEKTHDNLDVINEPTLLRQVVSEHTRHLPEVHSVSAQFKCKSYNFLVTSPSHASATKTNSMGFAEVSGKSPRGKSIDVIEVDHRVPVDVKESSLKPQVAEAGSMPVQGRGANGLGEETAHHGGPRSETEHAALCRGLQVRLRTPGQKRVRTRPEYGHRYLQRPQSGCHSRRLRFLKETWARSLWHCVPRKEEEHPKRLLRSQDDPVSYRPGPAVRRQREE
jgi:hypothetical protein